MLSNYEILTDVKTNGWLKVKINENFFSNYINTSSLFSFDLFFNFSSFLKKNYPVDKMPKTLFVLFIDFLSVLQEENCKLDLKNLYYFPKRHNEKQVFLKKVYILLHFFFENKVITHFSFDNEFFFKKMISWEAFLEEIKKKQKKLFYFSSKRFSNLRIS